MKSHFQAMQCMAFVILIFSVSSCSYFLEKFEDPSQEVVGLNQEKFGIVFSHNINGEMYPCGCRHYPLGGLAQVAGQIHKLKKTEQLIYIDSGDTLFPSSNIPPSLEKSTTYNAEQLAKGLSDAGLRYWVPGDQDYAKGFDFLKKITKTTKIRLLIGNLSSKIKIPHKEFLVFEKGPNKIFITGLIAPSIMPSAYKKDFLNPYKSLATIIKKMKEEKGYDPKNTFHRLVVVTHQGINNDKDLAKRFQSIDWIIGAHTMNFLRFPQDEGNTKIVQVLSRNHYLGHITFNLTSDKSKDTYVIHEIRDELKDEFKGEFKGELKDEMKPNPFLAFIDQHKEALSKIQIDEQRANGPTDSNNLHYATANTCIECHEAQGKFWQSTPHAIAYQSLRQAKEENNLTCVKCHSLGLGDKKGFPSADQIVDFEIMDDEGNKKVLTAKEHQTLRQQYWQELDASFGKQKIGSIRKLGEKRRRGLAQKWAQVDGKKHVSQNFTNVQCLNCHTLDDQHPFDDNPYNSNIGQRKIAMQDKCLTCHDPDQSPEWYQKNEKGLAGDVNYDTLNSKIKKMSCPAIKKD